MAAVAEAEDGDDIRQEELGMIESMYGGEGEFVAEPGNAFGFRLHLLAGHSTLEITVDLLEGYPFVAPLIRGSCDLIGREGAGELAAGISGKIAEFGGESCVLPIVEWMLEVAPGLMTAEESSSAPDAAPEPKRKSERRGSKCVLWHERGDLFEVGADWSMCHCISKDLSLSAGIAVDFKKEFGGIDVLKSQQLEVGGVGVLKKKERYVYHLVTKNKHGGKPSMQSLEASLCAMKAHISKEGVRKLAMPKMGCGLDRLQWSNVEDVVLRVFDDVDIEIIVRSV